MAWISGVAGGLLLAVLFVNVLRTLVVPRGLYSGLVFRLWWLLRRMLRLAAPRGGYEAIDRAQTWLAPLILIGMLATWLGGALVGYGLLHALSGLHWSNSTRLAVLIALQIAYLPTLYAAYNRRELEVTLLRSRAGEPAWGPEILARQWLVDTETALPELYRAWERLASDIGESHSTYPVLIAFRSPRPYRDWLVGLVAVMDAAAMQLAPAPHSAPPEARLVLRAGFTSLRDIARGLRLAYDPRPAPGRPDPARLRRVRGGGRHAGGGGLRRRAHHVRGMDPLPRLAGQLRGGRLRVVPLMRRGARAVDRPEGLRFDAGSAAQAGRPEAGRSGAADGGTGRWG
jgi:hypothetical protein